MIARCGIAGMLSVVLLASVPAADGIGGNGGLPSNGTSGNGGHGKNNQHGVGSQGGFSWGSMDLKAARELKKPIILYVHDDKVKKENHTITFFEGELFSDATVQQLMKDFTLILVPATAEWLQPYFIAKAQGGAGLFLMTFDGTLHGSWMKGSRPTLPEFTALLRSVLASNPKVVERFEKEKPLTLKFPNGQPVDLKPAPEPAKAQVQAQAQAQAEAVYSIAPDEAVRLDVIKRLAAEIAASTKAGDKIKTWITLGSAKEELAIATADAKTLSLLVQGNTLPIKWEKLNKEEIYDLSKNIAGNKAERLILSGEMAMALGHADEAITILAKARMADAALAPRIDTLLMKIQKTVTKPVEPKDAPAAAAPAAAEQPKAEEAPKTAQVPEVAAPQPEGEKAPVELP